MFIVSEAQATVVRAALEAGGEFDAMLKLREFFPGLTPEAAREAVRTIASWRPPDLPKVAPKRRAKPAAPP